MGERTREMRRIVVVGASLAGLEGAAELRRAGYDGELVVAGREPHRPYDRPPLSKELLDGRFSPAQVMLPSADELDVQWRLGTSATSLDAIARTVSFDGGSPEPFDGIVLATGADPIRPDLRGEGGAPLAGIHVVRTLDDSLALAAELRAGPRRVVVVGAGFIGAEVASSCRSLGLDVTVVEGLSTPMERVLGAAVGRSLARLQLEHGVDLRVGVTVTDVGGAERVEAVHLSDGARIPADVVVLAVGVRPATDWLRGSGLTLDGGVLCDETCLAAPGIVAAGDVARWPNRRFGELRRVEHWDNAIRQGRHAARRLLACADTPAEAYEPLPWFWSDQFGAKLQLVGTAADYEEFAVVSGSLDGERFVGAYRRGDRIIGVVALNAAKALLHYRGLLERRAGWADLELAAMTKGSRS